LNTQQFLELILPATGIKFIATPIEIDGRKVWKHIPCETFEQAQATIHGLVKRELNVYHACASYKQPFIQFEELNQWGKPKRKYRVADNVQRLRSLWLDIDAGEDKAYADQDEALEALEKFLEESELPQPLVVNSGRGLHVYWAMTQEVSPKQWHQMACILSAWATRCNLQHDTQCAVDMCRVLRPIGSFNLKGEPLPVEVISEAGRYEVQELALKLVEWAKQSDYRAPKDTSKPVVKNDLSYEPEYPPSSAYEIVKRCNQLQAFAQAKGDVDEPYWYAALGLIKHTVEGEELCHEWSSGAPDYTEEVTNSKIVQWVQGPATCAKFEQVNPAGCAGCPHQGKVKSPIQLGHTLADPEPVMVEDEDGQVSALDADFPPEVRDRFSWQNGQLVARMVINDDDIPAVRPFADMFFKPVNYFRDIKSGHYRMIWSVLERSGKMRDFELTGAAMSVGGQALFKELGEQGIVFLSGQKKHMEAYISTWFNALRKKTDEVIVFNQFGWQKDWSFVLGNEQYMSDGSVKRIKLTGNAATPMYADAFNVEGTVDEWVELVDSVYNMPGQEQYQLTLGIGFGAPLFRLFENYGGLIVNGYSPEKGLGKSTAGKLALGVYGDPKLLIRTKQQTTPKAFNAHCGVMNSLPVMLDEATNVDSKTLSEIAYTFSQGTPSQGLNPDGSMRTALYSWSTMLIANANRSMISTVGAGKANADAEMGRILEFQYKRVSTLDKATADEILFHAERVYGAVGRQYISYLVQNREKVTALLLKTQKSLDARLNMTTADRFHSAGIAAIIVGLTVAKQLGLVRFDLASLVDWTILKTRDLHDRIKDNLPPITDVFGQMLTEISSGFIVTNIEGDSRSSGKAALIIKHPVGQAITGRLVQEDGVLYLHQKAIHQWCAKNQADYNEMWMAVIGKGWATPDVISLPLGRGTKEYALSPTRCWRLDWDKMIGEGLKAEALQTVVAIR
jgi:hypothetical protein